MTLSSHRSGIATVLVPQGRIGTIEMDQLKAVLRRLLQRGDTRVVVNLEHVPEVSWSAIGALVEKTNEFRSSQGEFKLSGLNESLKSTFLSLGANRVMEFYDTETAAIESFRPAR